MTPHGKSMLAATTPCRESVGCSISTSAVPFPGVVQGAMANACQPWISRLSAISRAAGRNSWKFPGRAVSPNR